MTTPPGSAAAPDSAPDAASDPATGGSGQRRTLVLLLATGLLLIGLNLRMGVASVGPLLDEIRADLSLSSSVASLLTTIPVLAFGVFAFLTPILTRSIGLHRLLGAAMLVLAGGILLRLHPSMAALFGGTVIVGAAIAVGNVAMPAAIKQDFAAHAGLMMGLYSMILGLGAAMASGLSVPLSHATDGDWRLALAVWAVPALLALVVWLPQLRRGPAPRRSPVADDAEFGEPTFRRLLTDRVAVSVTLLMGLQSLSFYTMLTWVPTMFRDAGMSAAQAGWMLSFSAFPGIVASSITPGLARRIRPLWMPVAVAVACTSGAYAGMLAAPAQAPYLWMVFLGLGQGASLSLALTYIVWRSPDIHHTGHLSTLAQGVGYLIAALGPVTVGALHTATGSWTLPIVGLGVLLVAQLVAGVAASKDRHVLRPAAVPAPAE
ncbi:CynX/NimT family MFS transporter [Nocardioides insulae]|uniref:CynX/NimT family MFS transporter n=1 Tax=Nocardioides insulae TaxID=394734 RepID=UPI00040217A6|nr:MFS transporter [Nocardioides insulae]